MVKLQTRFVPTLVAVLISSCMSTASQADEIVHLFILSGQSNMAGLRPEESFTPAVEAEFGKENVIVVKDAMGGQPIRRWYKDWKPATGSAPAKTGDLYERLMKKVKAAVAGRKPASVTFVWMQGERDAKEKHGDVYEKSLKGLFDQVRHDLNCMDLNVVIGRLSDFDMKDQRYPHWTRIRTIQKNVADSEERGAWVDTDDLNDGKNRQGKEISNDLHYSAEGYRILGTRFANAAIKLIKSDGRP